MPRPNRGPHLKLNKSGYFEIVEYKQGRATTLSTETRDALTAQRALAEYILAAEQHPVREGWLVSEAWTFYKSEHLARKPGSDTTRAAYCWAKLEPHFGAKYIKRLTVTDVEQYIQKRQLWVQGSTIRRELAVLVSALHHMVKTKRVEQQELPYVPLPAQNPPKDRWLTAEEITSLLTTAKKRRVRWGQNGKSAGQLSRLELFLHIALQTGARRRVIERLTWDRVHFARGLIDFDYGGPQTTKRRPVVPISDALLPVLQHAYAVRENDYVLHSSGSVRKAFDRMVEEAGIPDVTRHTLRHTWATHASMNGVPLIDIARVLGDTLETVRRVYAHHQPQYLRHAVNFTPQSYEQREGT